MVKFLQRIYEILLFLGFDPKIMKKNLGGLSFYLRDLSVLKKQKGKDTAFRMGKKYPILRDRYAESGRMKGYYFHQDLYVASKIYENKPQRHVDIGSRTDGFVAHVAVFRHTAILLITRDILKPLTILPGC